MSDDSETETPRGAQLIDRAVAILRRLGDAGQHGVKAVELAGAVGLTVPTAHRIIAALERHGLVERERATKRYRLGLSLFALGAQAAEGTGLRRICRAALLRLAAETGDTVFLMARSGFNTVCVDRQEGTYMIDSLTRQVGGQIPLGVGPASQAILAGLPADEAALILEVNAPLYGRFNGLSAAEVAARLPEIRARGYADDHDRLVAGISAVAMAIRPQGRDVVGALAINMTSARLQPDRLEDLLQRLRREIDEIECSVNPMEAALNRQM